MFEKLKSEKGFITVLGSDLPSLLPIVVGLVLFFGMLQFSLNTVNERNTQLDLQRAGLQIAELMRGEGLTSSGDLGPNTGDLCRKAQGIPGSFIAGVVEADDLSAASEENSITALKLKFNGGKEYCHSGNVENDSRVSSTSQKVVYIFPTIYQNTAATEINDILDYRYLMVIIWT
ncbi:MAG: hypothetical protein GOV15_00895 [Candidatus Diapherotrites archaeon]|nr:hypothetical protein [Candidatus Diapherotrites archaeon]